MPRRRDRRHEQPPSPKPNPFGEPLEAARLIDEGGRMWTVEFMIRHDTFYGVGAMWTDASHRGFFFDDNPEHLRSVYGFRQGDERGTSTETIRRQFAMSKRGIARAEYDATNRPIDAIGAIG